MLPLNPLGGPVPERQQQHRVLGRGRRPLPRVPHEGPPGGVLLPAPLAAAAAEQPVGDDADVAELGGDAEPAAAQLVADDDAAAEAGAERDADDVVVALARAEAVLAPGGGVGVVLDDDGQADALLDLVLERLVAPVDVGREEDRGALVVDVSGGADADGLDLVALAGPFDRGGDGVHDGLGGRRCRHREGVEDRALLVHDSGRDLRAADVDADGQSHVSLSSGRAPLRATVPEGRASSGSSGRVQSRSMCSAGPGPSSSGRPPGRASPVGSSGLRGGGVAAPVPLVQPLSCFSTAER